MPERDNRKTLSEIGLTAKESSTFKQIAAPTLATIGRMPVI